MTSLSRPPEPPKRYITSPPIDRDSQAYYQQLGESYQTSEGGYETIKTPMGENTYENATVTCEKVYPCSKQVPYKRRVLLILSVLCAILGIACIVSIVFNIVNSRPCNMSVTNGPAPGSSFNRSKVCPAGFLLYPPSQKCYRLINERGTFDQQVAGCSLLDARAHLVAPLNAGEDKFIQSLITNSSDCQLFDQRLQKRYYNFYLGGRRFWSVFLWQLTDGFKQEMTYSNFAPGEPNFVGQIEFCIHYFVGFQWNDIPCTHQECAVCEYRLAR